MDLLEKLLTDEGKRKAVWILINAGIIEESDIKPEEPVIEERELSEIELNIFDTIESLIYMDEYEQAYKLAMGAIRRLIEAGRYKSALYVCQMIGDEIMRREILSDGLKYYESRGDFKNAMDFALSLGDLERYKTYEYLYKLYSKIYR